MLLRLLALPITAPIAGIRYCLEKVAEVAEHEMWDEGPVKEQLMLDAQALEEGRIDDETYREREAQLLARLREIRAHRAAGQKAEDASATGPRVVIELPDELR
jgi:hypothetical protein